MGVYEREFERTAGTLIPLSDNTQKLLDAVIPAAERERIANRILNEVSENIPYCQNTTPGGMDRIRFSVLRLLAERRTSEDDVFALARKDWRELFVAAGHESIGEHEVWAERVIRRAAEKDDSRSR